MRILHLISEKPPIMSGFSRVVSKLQEELIRMGNEVDVLSAQDCRHKVIGEIKLVMGASNVMRCLNDSYDIINIHGHTPTFSDRLFLMAKLSRKKVVYTIHCPADYFFKPISEAYNIFVNNILLKHADVVIVSSKSYYDILNSHPRKYIVPWGVDTDDFSGKRTPHNGYRLLFVGQMRPYKGIKILLRAVKGLDADLNIVGDGPDKLEYMRYAKRLGLVNVHFNGALPDEALRQVYLDSDVLVLPSISSNEAFGLVTLEAAAAGCAVVASDLPGVRDLVRGFGLLVRPNDPQSLRDAILMLEDNSIRKEHVVMGRCTVKKYSWEMVAEKYVRIYEKILS